VITFVIFYDNRMGNIV